MAPAGGVNFIPAYRCEGEDEAASMTLDAGVEHDLLDICRRRGGAVLVLVPRGRQTAVFARFCPEK